MIEQKLQKREPDFRKIFEQNLSDDGKKMFRYALEQYPEIAKKLANILGQYFYMGKIKGKLNANDIYGIFYELGYPIRLETKIVYKKKGRVKSIKELLNED